MTDFSNDIKRYLGGEMTPAERHALEKKALSDPFLAEALEGSELLSKDDFSININTLNSLIDQRINQNTGSISVWTWGLRLAAGLLLISISTYIAWNFVGDKTETPQLSNAEIKETEPTSASTMDSAVINTTKDQLALAEKPRVSEPEKSPKSMAEEPVVLTEELAMQGETSTAEDAEEVSKPAPLNESKSVAGGVSTEAAAEPTIATEAKKEVAILDDVTRKDKTAERSSKKTDAKQSVTARDSQSSTTIKGKVVSAEDGSPLPGVNVVIKGTTIGTVTDITGNYTLENASPTSTLVYSFIGLQSTEVQVGERKSVDVEMNLDVTQLSEVVVTGYGYSEKSETVPTVDLAHPTIGTRAYKKYLEENLLYPQLALDNKIEGRVTVEFFVEPDGSLRDFTIIKGIGSGCEEELIRLIKFGPTWTPTKKDEVAIRDKARVRLKFDLPKD